MTKWWHPVGGATCAQLLVFFLQCHKLMALGQSHSQHCICYVRTACIIAESMRDMLLFSVAFPKTLYSQVQGLFCQFVFFKQNWLSVILCGIYLNLKSVQVLHLLFSYLSLATAIIQIAGRDCNVYSSLIFVGCFCFPTRCKATGWRLLWSKSRLMG